MRSKGSPHLSSGSFCPSGWFGVGGRAAGCPGAADESPWHSHSSPGDFQSQELNPDFMCHSQGGKMTRRGSHGSLSQKEPSPNPTKFVPGATLVLLEGEDPLQNPLGCAQNRVLMWRTHPLEVQGLLLAQILWDLGLGKGRKNSFSSSLCFPCSALKAASNIWDQLGCSHGLVLREKQQNCLNSHRGFKNFWGGEFSPSPTGMSSLSWKKRNNLVIIGPFHL